MTRGSIREYTEAVQGRYLRASKKEKGGILDEFTKVTACHRKAAIRLFHRRNQARANKKRGRAVVYLAANMDWLDIYCCSFGNIYSQCHNRSQKVM